MKTIKVKEKALPNRKCSICGKFVGKRNNVEFKFVPDTDFGPEEFIVIHKKCKK